MNAKELIRTLDDKGYIYISTQITDSSYAPIINY